MNCWRAVILRWQSIRCSMRLVFGAMLQKKYLKDLQDSNSQVAIEMWRYDPRKLSREKMVDELSLALSLREDADERVEEAVEEMLNNLWRKIDGNRN